jgi:hypothetical protein
MRTGQTPVMGLLPSSLFVLDTFHLLSLAYHYQSLATFIAFGYYLIAQFSQPAAYNYWAVIALDAFLTTFWFISFIVLASEVSRDLAVAGGGDALYSAQGLAVTTVFAAFELSVLRSRGHKAIPRS